MVQNGKTQATCSYDVNGNRTRLTYPTTGTVTKYTYNLANWVIRIRSVDDGTTLANYTYTYYADGNRKREADIVNGTVTSYVYDDLGRLVQESETDGLTVAYTYDRQGNRTKMAVTGSETYTTTYAYDKNNRLTQEITNRGGIASTTVYTYDANGNLLQKSNPDGAVLYRYNGFNQLAAMAQGTEATGYAYNASGIRTAKHTENTDTYFLLDGGDVVAEYTDGEQTAHYVRGINLIRGLFGSLVRYYLYNAHGDVTVLTSGSGVLKKSYDYDAFGNE